jgi:D-3-phosphoglycerate dehydrogenase
VCSPTTGHNHIDIKALEARGVELLSLRGEREFLESIRATPEHTFGLILALLRRYGKAFSETAVGAWDRDTCRGEELCGMSVGIIGLGRVGYRVASYCQAFGANVCWYDTADVPSQPEWEKVHDIGSVIDLCRIVVLCASHEAGQDPIIGEAEIDALQGRYFINTARGELIDEPKLLSAIRNNRFAGVAIDVIANENGSNRLAEWRELMSGRNVLLTPHIAGATVESMKKTEMFIAQKLIDAMKQGEIR